MTRMRRATAMCLAAGFLFAAMPPATVLAAPAALQTRVFAVDKMNCETCPIAVKTAMRRVAGVREVVVDFAAGTATVTYDPAVATPTAIAAAATAIGYPAKLAPR